MFRPIAVVVTLIFILPLVAYAGTPQHADLWNGAQINWRDPRSGIYEASKTGRPVLMLFHATWCGACKKYREVFKDADIVEASRNFVMILVDVDTEKEVNGAFAPDGVYVPRTLFIDPEGTVSDKLVGKDPQFPHTIDIESPGELLALMRKAKDVLPVPVPLIAPGADRT